MPPLTGGIQGNNMAYNSGFGLAVTPPPTGTSPTTMINPGSPPAPPSFIEAALNGPPHGNTGVVPPMPPQAPGGPPGFMRGRDFQNQYGMNYGQAQRAFYNANPAMDHMNRMQTQMNPQFQAFMQSMQRPIGQPPASPMAASAPASPFQTRGFGLGGQPLVGGTSAVSTAAPGTMMPFRR